MEKVIVCMSERESQLDIESKMDNRLLRTTIKWEFFLERWHIFAAG